MRLKKAFDWEYYHPRHFKGCKKSYFPFLGKKDYIIVYPETVYGNPFNAKYVIRWVLYHYNYLGDRRAYSDLDLFVPYRDIFTDKVPRTAEKNVKVAFFDMMLYHRTNFGKRKGNCYIVRKGHNRADLPKEFDGPVVDDFSEEEKVRIFNECEYCYSYDMQTAYSAIAALCGCKSIVVPEPGKIRSDYYSGEDKCYGVAFGDSPEELARAESTLPLLSAALDYSERNIQAAKNMIENIEKGFNISVGK